MRGLIVYFWILVLVLLIPIISASTTKIYLLNGTEINDGVIINQTKINLIANNNESIGFILYSVEKTDSLIDRKLKRLCELCSSNIDYTRILRLSEGNNYIFVKDSINTTAQKTFIKVDTKMKVYERVEVELLKKIPALSLPTLYALNKLSECKNIPGVYEAMMDDDLWKTKEQTKDLRGVGDAIKENQ